MCLNRPDQRCALLQLELAVHAVRGALLHLLQEHIDAFADPVGQQQRLQLVPVDRAVRVCVRRKKALRGRLASNLHS